MAYAKIDTDPNKTAIKTTTGPSTDNATLAEVFPYHRHADRPVQRQNLLLRPPTGIVSPQDPYLSAISDLQSTLSKSLRTQRLIGAPWLIEPPDSESFHLASGIPIPAMGDGLFHTIVTITCPPGRNGVLNQIANVIVGGGFSDFSGDFLWQIVRNPGQGITAAERNYDSIKASLGLVSAPTKISAIRIYEGDVIQLVGQNVGLPAAGEECGGLLGGWFYPRTWDDQFDNSDQANAW